MRDYPTGNGRSMIGSCPAGALVTVQVVLAKAGVSARWGAAIVHAKQTAVPTAREVDAAFRLCTELAEWGSRCVLRHGIGSTNKVGRQKASQVGQALAFAVQKVETTVSTIWRGAVRPQAVRSPSHCIE